MGLSPLSTNILVISVCLTTPLPPFMPYLLGFTRTRLGFWINITDFNIKLNPLPYKKNLDQSRLKATAGRKRSTNQKWNFVWRWIENNVGIGENASYQDFLLCPQCFQRLSFSGH